MGILFGIFDRDIFLGDITPSQELFLQYHLLSGEDSALIRISSLRYCHI